MEKIFRLREWEERDIPSITVYANNKKIFDNVRDSFPYPYTEGDARKWIGSNKGREPANTFAIEVDGKAVGGIGLHLKADVYRRTIELGYWLGEPYWNKGISSAAVKEMIDYGFKTFDIVRIYAGVFETNKASMRVLEKAGFKLEAILKKSIIKNEVMMDEYIFTIYR